VVGEGGQLPLPWLRATLDEVLANQRGHALLLQGAPGIGSFEFALSLAQAWLCEAAQGPRPCGHCTSCRLVNSHTHADLLVRMPEEEAVARQWPVTLDEKRKPSRQIKIDEIRAALDWIVTTPARGRAKVLVLFPAEAMNPTAASALLKTLEEPPAGARLLLCAAEPAQLMPTVRSRCQRVTLPWPDAAQAAAWLDAQGIDGAPMLLAAAGGQPLEALRLHRQGVTAAAWAALPRRVALGDAQVLAGWGVPAVLDTLMKLCHDASVAIQGGSPRFFPAETVPATGSLDRLSAWHKTLQRVARHADHPWQEALAVEALVTEGREALAGTAISAPSARRPLDTLAR
jgi:DNA polymerase-3 subunit delta'